jgi:hypothetical protein
VSHLAGPGFDRFGRIPDPPQPGVVEVAVDPLSNLAIKSAAGVELQRQRHRRTSLPAKFTHCIYSFHGCSMLR